MGEAEKRAMLEEQKSNIIATRRQQLEVSRAETILKKEFRKDVEEMAKKAAKQAEVDRKAAAATTNQAIGKKRLAGSQARQKEIQGEMKKIEDEEYRKRGMKYLELKNSTMRIGSVIQASN